MGEKTVDMISCHDAVNVNSFIERQLQQWPLAAENFRALDNVEYRTFNLNGHKVKAQFNPARAVSTGAKVDKTSIAQRPCFLCAGNRDTRQQSIRVDLETDSYDILLNPFPIFKNHLTIPGLKHVDQELGSRVNHMKKLAAMLPGYTVFFNGATSGASAPDHVHFQAVPSHELPIWEWDTPERCVSDIALDPVFSAESSRQNILIRQTTAGIEAVVITRRAHRPACYTAEGTGGFMISPGAVDVAGVVVTPRKEDFNRLTPEVIESIYDDVIKDIIKITEQ